MGIAEYYLAFADDELGRIPRNNVEPVKPMAHDCELRVGRADVDIEFEIIGAGSFDNRGAAQQPNFEVLKCVDQELNLRVTTYAQVRARIQQDFNSTIVGSTHAVAGIQIVGNRELLPVRHASRVNVRLAGDG